MKVGEKMTEKKFTTKGYKVDLEKETVFVPGFGDIPWTQIKIAESAIKAKKGRIKAPDTAPWNREKDPVPDDFIKIYNDVKAGKITATEAMNQLGVCRATYYRYKKKYEAK